MKLEWFRQHKRFVYWILLPVVGIGMAFFGATSALQSARMARRGPEIVYEVGGVWRTMNPSEVIALRYELTQYIPNRYGGRQIVNTDEAAFHLADWHAAMEEGFDIGHEEALDDLREEVKGRTEQKAATDALYQKLLRTLQLSPAKFESMLREMGSRSKRNAYLEEQCKANDLDLFVSYCMEKETARLRYKEFKSADLAGKAPASAPDRISKCYDDYVRIRALNAKVDQRTGRGRDEVNKEIEEFRHNYKASPNELDDAMIVRLRLSADMVFLDRDKLFGGEVKATDDELKTYYEANKKLWKIEAPAGQPEKFKPMDEVKADVEAKWKEGELRTYYDRHKPNEKDWKLPPKAAEQPKAGEEPKAAEEQYKPFDEVKADVEKRWMNERKMERAKRRMNTLREQVVEAEKAYDKEEQRKPAAERKPFDAGAWAKSQEPGIVNWVTDELTDEQFAAGKREIGAKDAAWVQNIFFWFKDNQYFNADPRFAEMRRKNQKEFSYPALTDAQSKDQGVVMARARKLVPEEVRTPDAADAGISAVLQLWDAIEQVRAEWADGKLPPLDSLDEVSGNQASSNPLLRAFFKSPKAVGAVLEPVLAPANEPDVQNPDAGKRFYLGFAVERTPPSWEQFHHDLSWDRDSKRTEIARSYVVLLDRTMHRQTEAKGRRVGNMPDPPIFEEYRRGAPVSDED